MPLFPPKKVSPPPQEVAEDESARLIRLEQSVTALWEQVEAGGRWAEQRHKDVLQLYAELRQEKQQRDGDGVWLTSLMEQQLEHFRTQLDKERQQEEQVRSSGIRTGGPGLNLSCTSSTNIWNFNFP